MKPQYLKSSNFFGVILIILGISFLIQQTTDIKVAEWILKLWPLIFIYLGIQSIINKNSWISSILFFMIGIFFQLSMLNFINWDFWAIFGPIILIIIGFNLLLGRKGLKNINAKSQDNIELISIFGGNEYKIQDQEFKTATVTSIFGGSKLDLKNALINQEETIIDITSIFGGVEIIVPTNVIIKNKIVAILGGLENKASYIKNDKEKNKKYLIIQGFAIFGGVEIKN